MLLSQLSTYWSPENDKDWKYFFAPMKSALKRSGIPDGAAPFVR
jgi:hypothetical protein